MSIFERNKTATLHDFGSGAVDKVVPVDFILVPTGTYQEQHHRSWESGKSMKAINQITRSIRATGANRLNSTMVASAGGLLSVSTTSQGQVAVPNGWTNRRGMFVMGFDFYMRNGEVNRYYVQGMTDSDDFNERNLSPNLTFYVNNVMMLRPVTRTVAGVARAQGWTLSKNYQPLMRFNHETGQAHAGEATVMRPRDILARMSNQQMSVQGYGVVDDSIRLSSTDMITSSRLNSIPSTMSTRLLNAYVDSAVQAADEYDNTVGDVAERAYDAVPERESVDDQFFHMLRDRNQFSTTSFTWAHLQKVVPNILEYRKETKAAMRGYEFRSAGDSDSFGASNDTTKLMVNLQSSVPALMLECMAVNFVGTITNKTLDRQPELRLSHIRFIDNSKQMVDEYAPLFESRLLREIVPSLAFDMDGFEFSANIACAYNGDFEVVMEVNGKQSSMIAPAFCNAWFSPTMTGNEDQAIGISEQISTVCATVADEVLTGITRRAANTLSNLDNRPDNFDGIKQGDVIGVGAERIGVNRSNPLERLQKIRLGGSPSLRSLSETTLGARSSFGNNADEEVNTRGLLSNRGGRFGKN